MGLKVQPAHGTAFAPGKDVQQDFLHLKPWLEGVHPLDDSVDPPAVSKVEVGGGQGGPGHQVHGHLNTKRVYTYVNVNVGTKKIGQLSQLPVQTNNTREDVCSRR